MTDQNGIAIKQREQEVVVVMVPFPAQGHLNQLLQLSRLILSYNIPIHYVGSAIHNRQAQVRVQGWVPLSASSNNNNIHFHDFEIPPYPCPPPNPNAACKFPSHIIPCCEASKHLRHPLATLLKTLSATARRVVVVHDSLMASVIQDVCLIRNAESYTFHSVSAFTVYLYIWERMGNPNLNEADGLFPKDVPSLEGCFPSEFLDSIASEYEHMKFKFNSGNVYNTSRVIESAYMDLLEKATVAETSNHWALGPLNPVTLPNEGGSSGRHFCLEWLDKQEKNSVLYVSFGTTTTMRDEQIKELAVGLKRSNQKFIWVLRDADRGDVFNGEVRRAELPKGYEDSVKDKGLVVRDWAPQLEILAHRSTGGFMSHCGWNSCMESITMGVPIVAWPMHSDQPRNTVLITQLLKLGLVMADWARRDEIVTSNVIENAVKRLMASKEGDEIRKRAVELGITVRRSVDDGGVSRMEFDSFIAHITR